ncbi:MAG TPA: protein kinase [Kofleriaceae bacterium]|nr:protein kinase [Kofleriaceae bacterium]
METRREGPGARAPAAEPQEQAVFAAGTRVHQYEIIRELGRGGMGRVYLARDTRLGRRVAIKFLLTSSAAVRQRFLAEARATARCVHENIVVIHEVDEIDGAPFMVLEYIEGETLRTHMVERRLTPLRAVELMIPVVHALERAHAAGIVHRDLKPDNILLTTTGLVKVLDFGIAKAVAAEVDRRSFSESQLGGDLHLTREGTMVGTLPFMAPEQLGEGPDIDARADLWAVGIILYWMIAGRHPLHPLSEAVLLGSARALERPMPGLAAAAAVPDALAAAVDACLRKHADDRVGSAAQLSAMLEAILPGRRGRALAEGESPYPGLAAFQEADADRFFGRDRDIARTVARLREQPLVGVVGPSGVGKSSFIAAGLLPALKASGQAWDLVRMRPGRQPLDALARMVQSGTHASGERDPSGDDPVALARQLGSEPGALGRVLRARAQRTGGSTLLFVDQFEELYTLGAGEEERRAFLACLAGVGDDPDSPLRVILSVRSDFLDRAMEDPRLMEALSRGLVFLGPPDRAGLRDALVQPVEMVGYRFESLALIDQMLDDLGAAAGALPLLQFAASKLWDARDLARRLITQASFSSVGGVSGALAAHADEVVTGLSPAERQLARTLFARLVTPERTRAAVDLADLSGQAPGPAVVQRLVDRLVRARLLVVKTTGDDDAVATVEIVHESLIEKWPTLRRWLDETQEDAAFLAQLSTAAKQWETRGRKAGLLWRGEALDEARRWRSRSASELPAREAAFLAAALKQASRATRLKRLAVVLLAAVAVLLLVQNSRIARQRATALSNKQAAEDSARRMKDLLRSQYEDQGRRLLLAGDPLQALAFLREAGALGASGVAHELLVAQAVRATDGEVAELRHENIVGRVRFSPDGARIATASYDGTARVWDAATGAPQVTLQHEGPVLRVEWSPDGARLATAGQDGASLWDAATGARVVHVPMALGARAAVLSPDGARLAVVSTSDGVQVWDVRAARLVMTLRPDAAEPTLSYGSIAAFSPDGAHLAVGDAVGQVVLWDRAGRRVATLGSEREQVTFIRFSPDGKRLAVARRGHTAEIWNLSTGTESLRLRHDDVINAIWFSPDGRRLLTASNDRTAVVWDAATGLATVDLAHAAAVSQAAWNNDGTAIATACEDGTAHLWDAATGRRLAARFGHQGPVKDVVFSPAGDRMATSSIDGSAFVWSTAPTIGVAALRGHEGTIFDVQVAPVTGHIATAGSDGTVRLWDALTGRELVRLPHGGPVKALRFTADGARLATGGSEGVVRVWDARSGELRAQLPPLAGWIDHISWDPAGTVLVATHGGIATLVAVERGRVLRDLAAETELYGAELDGGRLVTTSADNLTRVLAVDGWREVGRTADADTRLGLALDATRARAIAPTTKRAAKIWRVDTGATEVELRGHQGHVTAAGWGARDQLVVTGSLDGTARIWSTRGEMLAVLELHAEVRAAALSADGRFAAAVGGDGNALVWELPRLDRDAVDLERILRCRVPFRVESDKVVPVERDRAACMDLHRSRH